MWLQRQIRDDKDGEDKWRLFITQLNTPPPGVPDTLAGRRSAPSQAEQIKAAAMAAVGHEGAAFAASLGVS